MEEGGGIDEGWRRGGDGGVEGGDGGYLVRATSAAVARAHPIMSTHIIRKKRSFHENGCCG